MTFDIEKHARTKPEVGVPAPGEPGRKPRWTTGAKTAVGTAVAAESRVWFTISHGFLNEIYFPSIDQANTRTMRFLVADGKDFFSDEQTDATHTIEQADSGVPAFVITSKCKRGRYELRKKIITDPERDVLLMRVEFKQTGNTSDLALYVLLDPQLEDLGSANEAWAGEYKGRRMLFARRGGTALALDCSCGFAAMSCGYAGVSDGWTDLNQHKRMTWNYTTAPKGDVILCGRFPCESMPLRFTLALAFGGHAAEAGQQARAGLLAEFATFEHQYVQGWQERQRGFLDFGKPGDNGIDLYRVSTAVLQTHSSKRFPGAMVAGLSIPWGFDRGDKDVSGYHVIWPRDLVHAALGKLAAGDPEGARRTLFYLMCTQEADGNWPQNMWLDGTPHWTGIQMDGTGFGIILADALRRAKELQDGHPWEMICKAAGFLVRNGPVTQQERWEENSGYSSNTMAVEIAALLAAADFADEEKLPGKAEFLRATADAWNETIDELTYTSGTDLARGHGVKGYYIRIAPPEVIRTGLRHGTQLRLKNLPEDRARMRAVDVVSPDALALVRFGLRAADDPRIADTVRIIDATLKSELSNGPVWHRYTNDGYGEHPDGAPFDNTGQGRGWPLLSGERGHYEIARGNTKEAEHLLNTMAAQTSECGLIPEQVWDAADIPAHELFNGKPTGSGMPLVWAHSEYVQLLRSIKEEKVWSMPPQPADRYQVQKRKASFAIWTFGQQRSRLAQGKNLRVDLGAPANVRWSGDDWKLVSDTKTTDSGFGVHYAMLSTAGLKPGDQVRFTFFWLEVKKWEGRDFEVGVI